MIRFIAKRLGSGLVVLVVVSGLTFFLLYISSASIARNILGDQATAEQVAMKEHELGLDQPLVARTRHGSRSRTATRLAARRPHLRTADSSERRNTGDL